jgi:transposase-like protein
MKRPRRNGSQLRAIAAKERWTADDARHVLDALEKSDSTITEFCRKHRVSHFRIFDWRRKFREGRIQRDRTPPATFLPVTVVEDDAAQALIGEPVHSWALEIELGDCRIRVAEAASEAVVGRVIRAVRTASC